MGSGKNKQARASSILTSKEQVTLFREFEMEKLGTRQKKNLKPRAEFETALLPIFKNTVYQHYTLLIFNKSSIQEILKSILTEAIKHISLL